MSSKELFFRFTKPLSNMLSVETLRKLSGVQSVIPLYHAVSDEIPAHLKYLYPIRATWEFEQDLDLLCKHYKPITLAELLDLHKKNRVHKEKVFHLTFDDGLSEFSEVVAPLLKQKGIPATCFLNNDFLDNKDLFFRFKASQLIDKLHHAEAGSDTWKKFHQWTQENQLGHGYYRKLLLGLSFSESHKLDRLAESIGLSFAEYLKEHKPYLTSETVSKLIKDGFTFGAHSAAHPKYSELTVEEQIATTLESVNSLSSKFELGYQVFSFPFTDDQVTMAYFDSVKDKLDLSFGCAGIKYDAASINLQRLPVELYTNKFSKTLKQELLYFIFLRMLGVERIKR